ncbi:MAG: hypothetical protein RL117_1771, partial [Verrucomicrobiota bacterium]
MVHQTLRSCAPLEEIPPWRRLSKRQAPVAEAYRLPALKKTPISHVGKENPNPNRDRYPNRKIMALGHEKLDVYRLAISYVA